jgi:hypothetical protein
MDGISIVLYALGALPCVSSSGNIVAARINHAVRCLLLLKYRNGLRRSHHLNGHVLSQNSGSECKHGFSKKVLYKKEVCFRGNA